MGKDIALFRLVVIVPFWRRRVVRVKRLISASAASIIRARVGPAVNAGLARHSFEITTPGGSLVVSIVVDDSGSARIYRRAFIAGINKVAALIMAEASAYVGATLTMKAMKSETPWIVGLPIDRVKLPIGLPYTEQGNTPRFRAVLETLGLSLAMIASQDVPGRSVTLIVTDDRKDNASWPTTAEDVALVVREMRRRGHIIRGLGVGNPIDYRATFRSMGLRDEDIYDCDGDLQITAGFEHFGAIANSSRRALTTGH